MVFKTGPDRRCDWFDRRSIRVPVWSDPIGPKSNQTRIRSFEPMVQLTNWSIPFGSSFSFSFPMWLVSPLSPRASSHWHHPTTLGTPPPKTLQIPPSHRQHPLALGAPPHIPPLCSEKPSHFALKKLQISSSHQQRPPALEPPSLSHAIKPCHPLPPTAHWKASPSPWQRALP